MSKLSMTVAGREVTLRWTVRAQVELEEQGWHMDKMWDELEGDAPTKPRAILCAVMINAGAKHEGKEADMTADWLLDNATPLQMRALARLSNLAVQVGHRRQLADENDDEIIDVVLEELKKKKTASEAKDTSAEES